MASKYVDMIILKSYFIKIQLMVCVDSATSATVQLTDLQLAMTKQQTLENFSPAHLRRQKAAS